MKIDLICVTNGKTNVVETVSLDKGVHLNDEYNYLCVNVEKNCIKVSAGIKHLEGVISHMMTDNEAALTDGFATVKVGCVVGEGALMSIERTVLKVSEVDRLPANVLETHWTCEALDRHFAISKDPFEGYWTYLDRDMEDRWLKIGGRYTIALVATEQGYDVIYVDGAQVKKSQWHTGMKKAEMKKSIFTDNFTARWIDATLESIDDDVYVTFESGVILTFKFPVYKSQIRFSKILE